MSEVQRIVVLGALLALLAGCGSGKEEDEAASGPAAGAPQAAAPQQGMPQPAAAPPSAELEGLPEALNELGCFACHGMNEVRIGPPYRAIAARYRGDPDAAQMLTSRVIAGGGGAWGPVPMIAHPHLKPEQVRPLIDAILAIK